MIPFLKMHGLGNDFVVIDTRKHPLTVNSAWVQKIADRRTGIGCDQVILIGESTQADVRMRIFNPDGSESSTCGNATRCVAWLVKEQQNEVMVETNAGILKATIVGDQRVTVDMGSPKLAWKEIPLSEEQDTLHLRLVEGELRDPVAISMGNPHVIFFVKDLKSAPVTVAGPRIENSPLFPERTNVEFAQIESRQKIILRVWERGAGETLACGSGACATLVAAVLRGLAERKTTVVLPGGELEIEWLQDSDKGYGSVLMTGPVAVSYSGESDL